MENQKRTQPRPQKQRLTSTHLVHPWILASIIIVQKYQRKGIRLLYHILSPGGEGTLVQEVQINPRTMEKGHMEMLGVQKCIHPQ